MPSLSLMNQTINAFFKQKKGIYGVAVCSDTTVNKKSYDEFTTKPYDLELAPTTDPKLVGQWFSQAPEDKAKIVFSTYQSISVLEEAQKQYGLPEFSLIICDEAHRTATATKKPTKEITEFAKVHEQGIIKGAKRLYMTATPKIFGESIKKQVQNKVYGEGTTLYSMDDSSIFGEKIFHYYFDQGVKDKILSDYKVKILVIDEQEYYHLGLKLKSESDNDLNVGDATKLIGVYKSITGLNKKEEDQPDKFPLKRSLVFCKGAIKGVGCSRNVAKAWPLILNAYQDKYKYLQQEFTPAEVKHIGGEMSNQARDENIKWLEDINNTQKECRLLSNDRCLSEGIDVPALNTVIFLHPRKSRVQIVQAVGRVMRKAKDKKMGYIILPVVFDSKIPSEEAISKNKKYKVVWEVLNALRSHDKTLDTVINRIRLSKKADVSDKIEIEVLNVGQNGNNHVTDSEQEKEAHKQQMLDLKLEMNRNITENIRSAIVSKCGTRGYWRARIGDMYDVVRKTRHLLEERLKLNIDFKVQFKAFIKILQTQINESIQEHQAIKMVAQHMIMSPIFDALFKTLGSDLTNHNPVSKAITKLIEPIKNDKAFTKETTKMKAVYDGIKDEMAELKGLDEKQSLIKEIYEEFHQQSDKNQATKLGVVYTPIEIVDFILHSANYLLQEEFKTSFNNKNVSVLDPFAGTGSFITRLLQSKELISNENLAYKYQNEIYAIEIMLLSYYIANVNIEQVFFERHQKYEPFQGMVLTDTFKLNNDNNNNNTILQSFFFAENSERITKLKNQPIKVIIGNPPYSKGRKSGNDNTPKVKYDYLDDRIKKTYLANTESRNKNSIYDFYIRAIRWASDKLKNKGVIGFITNNGWLNSKAAKGLRKVLGEEFYSIYIFDLKGNIRASISDPDPSIKAKEGENVFGIKTGVSIMILVKKEQDEKKKSNKPEAQIFYCPIYKYGMNMKTKEKLKLIKNLKSMKVIQTKNKFQLITPDIYNDWLDQVPNNNFNNLFPSGDKKVKNVSTKAIFFIFSQGLKSNRTAWAINSNLDKLAKNMENTINFYMYNLKLNIKSNEIINNGQIKWTDDLRSNFDRNKSTQYNPSAITLVYKKLFLKEYAYYDRFWNERVYQNDHIFPLNNKNLYNECIFGNEFGYFISDCLVEHNAILMMQVFPKFIYQKKVFDNNNHKYEKISAVSNYAREYFKAHIKNCPKNLSKVQIFYYTYGVLKHPDYLKKYKLNIKKTDGLPRIPAKVTYSIFQQFEQAGRSLAQLHLNYDKADVVPPYQNFTFIKGNKDLANHYYRFNEKIQFVENPDKTKDKTKIIFNEHITIGNIPLEAYDFKIGSRSAIEHFMANYKIKVDKASGIIDDPNDFDPDPKSIFNLLLSVITLSLESLKIIKQLPDLPEE